jgi:hypothetical protein
MTILLATKRDSFAILASERLESWPDKPSRGCDSKLVRHTNPNIPLAFGVTTGNSEWVRAAWQKSLSIRITAFLQEVADEVNSLNSLVLSDIADRVKAKLQPGYEEMQREAVVAIALFRDGRADIGFQYIGSRQDLEEGLRRPFLPGSPSSLTSFYTQACYDFLHDPRITNATDVVEIVRNFVVLGIKYENATVPQDKRQCGGKVDVMLVDKDGARLV